MYIRVDKRCLSLLTAAMEESANCRFHNKIRLG